MPFGFGRRGGRGRHGRGGLGRGGGRGSFVAGDCLCPRCGAVLPHRPGVPCFQIACPGCGSPMTRRFNVPGEGTLRRAAASSEKPAVDQDACTGCQKCVSVCPENAIEMRDDKAFILADPCTNCRVCIPDCPVGAIG
jgi:electron transport complex protein RnfB